MEGYMCLMDFKGRRMEGGCSPLPIYLSVCVYLSFVWIVASSINVIFPSCVCFSFKYVVCTLLASGHCMLLCV